MKTAFRLLVLAGLLWLACWACLFQVNENEHVIVARFGDPRRVISEAGLAFKWPPPVDVVIRIDGRMHVLDPQPDEYLTGDKKNVMVDSFLAWSVDDPLKFLKSVGSRMVAESRLTDVLRSVVGDVLSAEPFASLVSNEAHETTLRDMEERITAAAAAEAQASYGVSVAAVRIKRLNYPLQNKQAVFRRMEQERESIAQGIRSEGTEQYERIKADADREEVEMVSAAERRAQELRGEAEAEATRIYTEAHSRDPDLYQFLRSLETLEKILDEGSTVILPSDHELLKVLEEQRAAAPPASGQG